MDGMMPVDPQRKDVQLVPAVADAGWRGMSTVGTSRRWAGRRAWTATDPLPPALLIGAVFLADVTLVAGAGLAISTLPDAGGRPAPAVGAPRPPHCPAP